MSVLALNYSVTMQTNTSKKMDFNWGEAEKHLPGIFGSVIYFFYMRVYQNERLKKSLVALFTGWMFAYFTAPQVSAWVTGWRSETVGFIVGMLGMKVAEALVSLDVKGIVKKTVDKTVKGGGN